MHQMKVWFDHLPQVEKFTLSTGQGETPSLLCCVPCSGTILLLPPNSLRLSTLFVPERWCSIGGSCVGRRWLLVAALLLACAAAAAAAATAAIIVG